MSILEKSLSTDKKINLCMEAWLYAEYHKKIRTFARIYVRSFNPDGRTKNKI